MAKIKIHLKNLARAYSEAYKAKNLHLKTRDIHVLMISFKNISDTLLLISTKNLAREERELTLKILHHLREVERRYLFATLGFSSLYDYAIKELGYTEASAHRRISSMRLLKNLPEIEAKIESGVLPLSTLAQAQTFFRQEGIKDESSKLEVLGALEGKSSREVQRELVTRSSEPEKLIPEKLRAVSATQHQLSILIDSEMLKQIEEVKLLLSGHRPGMSFREVISYCLGETLAKKRMKAPKVQAPTPASEAMEVPSANKLQKTSQRLRYIPLEVRRAVWERDGGQCGYKHALSGRCCESKSGLELDHIIPFAAGGESTVENLRLRCRVHNTLAAVEFYGAAKMSRHVGSLSVGAR